MCVCRCRCGYVYVWRQKTSRLVIDKMRQVGLKPFVHGSGYEYKVVVNCVKSLF